MYLNLRQARLLCKRLGLNHKAITRLRLRPNMEESAVRTLVSSHLNHAKRRGNKPPERPGSPTPGQ
jgi:hypothetical protein